MEANYNQEDARKVIPVIRQLLGLETQKVVYSDNDKAMKKLQKYIRHLKNEVGEKEKEKVMEHGLLLIRRLLVWKKV